MGARRAQVPAEATIQSALPILFVVSAIVFGPLSAWLAFVRDRSATIWFAFGLLLGPIAPVLIALAPPGRCRVCGARGRGWLRTCDSCGAPLDGATRVAVRVSTAPGPTSSIDPGPPVPTTARSTANLAAVGAVPAASMTAGPVAPAAQPSAARGTPETEILATGVFVGGSVHLSLGARYAIARRKRTFEVRGPVDIAPGVLRLEHAMTGLDATVVADRLVVTEKTAGRPSFVIVFQSLSVQDGIDLESTFGARKRAPRRTSDA